MMRKKIYRLAFYRTLSTQCNTLSFSGQLSAIKLFQSLIFKSRNHEISVRKNVTQIYEVCIAVKQWVGKHANVQQKNICSFFVFFISVTAYIFLEFSRFIHVHLPVSNLSNMHIAYIDAIIHLNQMCFESFSEL